MLVKSLTAMFLIPIGSAGTLGVRNYLSQNRFLNCPLFIGSQVTERISKFPQWNLKIFFAVLTILSPFFGFSSKSDDGTASILQDLGFSGSICRSYGQYLISHQNPTPTQISKSETRQRADSYLNSVTIKQFEFFICKFCLLKF